jgi:hypothetical protein
MTVDEIQRIIEQMLSVQRELQGSQLRIQESQLRDRQDIESLIENSSRQQRLLDRLIGYSITTESNHLDLEQRLNELERKFKRFEDAS